MAGRRRIGFMPFQWVLVLYEMQLTSSRIKIHVDASISYGSNHYTMATSTLFVRSIYFEGFCLALIIMYVTRKDLTNQYDTHFFGS